MKQPKLVLLAILSAGLIIFFNNCSGAFHAAPSANDSTTSSTGSTPPTNTPTNTPPSTPVAGAPSAPSIFLLSAEGQNSVSLVWTPATAGTNPVASYNIYRNGVFYANTTSTNYTDNNATNITSPNYSSATNVYTYAVSAVDTEGNEGALQTNLTYWLYNTDASININPLTPNNGVVGNYIDGNFYCGSPAVVTTTLNDTAGDPLNGLYDWAFSGCGYNQPLSGPPTAPNWALSLAPFNYMTIDFKIVQPESGLGVDIISRVPPGDEYNNGGLDMNTFYANENNGATIPVGQWVTYKIPLNELSIGTVQFTGSISNGLLNVTSIQSGGISILNSMWVTGAGIPSGTYITSGPNGSTLSGGTGTGGTGTYTISNSNISVPAGTTLTGQRYNWYKANIGDGSTDLYYINNIGFSVD